MAQSHGVLIAAASSTTLQSTRSASLPASARVLLKNFPFAAGAGQIFLTDWERIDSQFQNGTIHVHCQALAPTSMMTGLGIRLFTSFDTVESNPIGSPISVLAVGAQSSPVSADLGPLVRLRVANGEVVPSYAILSIWLQPKTT